MSTSQLRTNEARTAGLTLRKVKSLGNHKVLIAYLLALLIFVAGQIISPGFGEFSNIMNVLNISALLGFIALAQMLVVMSGGEGIDLSVGAMASLGAVMSSQIIGGLDGNLPLAVIVVLLIGFLIGCVSGLGISYFKVPPLVMTLAMASVIQGGALVYTNGQPKGMASPLLKELGTGRTAGIPHLVLLWIVIAVIVAVFLLRTKWGKVLYGLGTNQLTTELSGVRTKVVRTVVYGASGAISAIGGMLLLSYTGTAFLDIGATYMLPTVIAVVIGGISLAGGLGSYNGTVAGAILLTSLSSILITMNITEGGRQIVYGVILLLLLIAYGRQKMN
ncbi:ABC transporter permease [Cohnella herbarum]|uniref:Autoinducer 2 import system permease protein LsrD n=1 Tax=Cohnella herbarum TaxID=2728023 RepID=A0A7Z2ZPX1_9BACL|nr:ABC transporter permease [Cohnella herbarum]QJD87350.1 ABC transporter permease [Cohnella herbarum]